MMCRWMTANKRKAPPKRGCVPDVSDPIKVLPAGRLGKQE